MLLMFSLQNGQNKLIQVLHGVLLDRLSVKKYGVYVDFELHTSQEVEFPFFERAGPVPSNLVLGYDPVQSSLVRSDSRIQSSQVRSTSCVCLGPYWTGSVQDENSGPAGS